MSRTRTPTIEVWMPIHFTVIAKETALLTEAEEGVYYRLLLASWLNGPPPADDTSLARIARVSGARWRKLKPALIPLFKTINGRWVHQHTEDRRNHALGVREAKKRSDDGDANGDANGTQMRTVGDANASIRALGSSSDRLVLTYPSQEVATDYQDSSTADVIPLAGRAGR